MSRRSVFSITGAIAMAAAVVVGPMAEDSSAQGISISIGSRRSYSGFRHYSYPYRSYSTGYGFRSYRPGRSIYYTRPGHSFYYSRSGYSAYPVRSYSYSYGPGFYGGYSYRPVYSSYYGPGGYPSYSAVPYGYSTYSGIGVSISPFCVW